MRRGVRVVLVLGLAACGGTKPTTGKLAVSLEGAPATDVTSVAFKIVGAGQPCSAPAVASATAPVGEDGSAVGASTTFALPAGTYGVCATPLTSSGQVSATWGAVTTTAVVAANMTTTETLEAKCASCADGGVDGPADAAADLAADGGLEGSADADAATDLSPEDSADGADGAGAAVGATGGGGGAAGAGGAGGSAGSGPAGAGGGSGSPKLYALLDGGGSAPSSLEIVDAVTWTFIRKVTLDIAGDFDVDPSGERIFVVGPTVGDSNFHALSTTTGAELSGPRPAGSFGTFTVSPDGATIFALGAGAPDPGTGRRPTVVVAIDMATLTISDSLSMTDGQNFGPGFPISPDGAELAFFWLAAPQFQTIGLRTLHTACGLGVDSTSAFSNQTLDWKSPVFTADGRVLLWEENNMYISVDGQMPYLNPHPPYVHLGSCVQQCLAYDPVTQTGLGRGNFWDLEVFDLAHGTASVIPLTPTHAAIAQQVVARPGGGVFADVRYTATPQVPDTINDATGKVVYTFSEARPVTVLRIARTR